MSLTKQFPIACNVFENFAKLQKFRARIWKKCRTAKKLLFTASPSGSCQLWFKRFRAHMACTRHFFNSCATFLKTSKVANFPTQVWELFLCVQTSRVENFRAQVFCEMTRMKHFPLACNFVQTLQSANFRARFWDFFFCLRSVAHEIFSARVQLFANFSKFRFSCTSFGTFFWGCEVSRTKYFPLACNFLQTFQSSDFRARFWSALFSCATCRALQHCSARAQKNSYSMSSPSGSCHRV